MGKWRKNERLLKAKKEKGVLIAAHRGTCGGNIIQNTCLAYENALQHGADILEVDAVMSTDGDFFAFHNGQEPRVLHIQQDIRKMSTAQIEACSCYNPAGHDSGQKLERLEAILGQFRDRCLINIDRTWFYWREVIDFLDRQDMAGQLLLKSHVERGLLAILQDSGSQVMYMPILKSPEEWKVVKEYGLNLAAVELVFEDMDNPLASKEFLEELREEGVLAWVNAINLDGATRLSGGLDDGTAVGQGYGRSWGKLIDMGFDIIQTDWPGLLKKYLVERGIGENPV